MSTARYALILYIKQTRLFFKGLSKTKSSCPRARQEGISRMEVFLIRRLMASESSA